MARLRAGRRPAAESREYHETASPKPLLPFFALLSRGAGGPEGVGAGVGASDVRAGEVAGCIKGRPHTRAKGLLTAGARGGAQRDERGPAHLHAQRQQLVRTVPLSQCRRCPRAAARDRLAARRSTENKQWAPARSSAASTTSKGAREPPPSLRHADRGKAGNFKELNDQLIKLDYRAKRVEVEDMIWEVDEDCDHAVSWDEFKLMFHRFCPKRPDRPRATQAV